MTYAVGKGCSGELALLASAARRTSWAVPQPVVELGWLAEAAASPAAARWSLASSATRAMSPLVAVSLRRSSRRTSRRGSAVRPGITPRPPAGRLSSSTKRVGLPTRPPGSPSTSSASTPS